MGSNESNATARSANNDAGTRPHSMSSNSSQYRNSYEGNENHDEYGTPLSSIDSNDSSHSHKHRFSRHFSIFSKLSNRSRSNSTESRASGHNYRSPRRESSHLNSKINEGRRSINHEGVGVEEIHNGANYDPSKSNKNSYLAADPIMYPRLPSPSPSRSRSNSTTTDRRPQSDSIKHHSPPRSHSNVDDTSLKVEQQLVPTYTNVSVNTSNSIGSGFPVSLIPSIGSVDTTNMEARDRRNYVGSKDLESQLDNRLGIDTYAIRHSEDLSKIGHNMLSSVYSAAQAAANTLSEFASNSNTTVDQLEGNNNHTHSRRWNSLDLDTRERKERAPGQFSSKLSHSITVPDNEDESYDKKIPGESDSHEGKESHYEPEKNKKVGFDHNNEKEEKNDANNNNVYYDEKDNENPDGGDSDFETVAKGPKKDSKSSTKRKSRSDKSPSAEDLKHEQKISKDLSRYDKSGLLVKVIRERRHKRREKVRQKISDGIHRRKDKKNKAAVDVNEKQDAEFHRLFKNIPDNEKLLRQIPCAYNKEILLQGKMYVSTSHIRFYAHILGWTTTNILPFDEIISIEAKNTAGLFPNGIVVQTTTDRYTYASFSSRDDVLKFLTDVWKKNSGYNKRSDDDTIADSGSEISDSDYDSENSGYEDDTDGSYTSEDDELDDTSSRSFGLSKEKSEINIDGGSEIGSEDEHVKSKSANNKSKSRHKLGSVSLSTAEPKASGSVSYPVPLEGPEKHEPVSIDYDPESIDEKSLGSEVFSAPLGVVFGIFFGEDTSLYKYFLSQKENNRDVPDIPKFSLKDNKKTRVFEYIKPLNGPIGPKQTRIICTEVIDHLDFDESITVLTTSQTPDVPSGNSFTIKTRYTFHWTDNNATKLIMGYRIDWTGKSWIKGAIEKGSRDGQAKFFQSFTEYLNDVLSKSGVATKEEGGKKHKKAKKTDTGKRGIRKTLSAENVEEGDRSKMEKGIMGTISKIAVYRILAILPVWIILLVLIIAYFICSIIFIGSRFTSTVSVSSTSGTSLIDNLDFAILSPYRRYGRGKRERGVSLTSDIFSNELNWDNTIFDWIDDRVNKEIFAKDNDNLVKDPLKLFVDLHQSDFSKAPDKNAINKIRVQELAQSLNRNDLVEAIEINQAKLEKLKASLS